MAISNRRTYVIRPERFSQLLAGIDAVKLIPTFVRKTYTDNRGFGWVQKMIRPNRAAHGYSSREVEWKMTGYDPTAVSEYFDTLYSFAYAAPIGSGAVEFALETEIDEQTYTDALRASAYSEIPPLFKLQFSDGIENHLWHTTLFYERASHPDRCPGFVLGLAEVSLPEPLDINDLPRLPGYLDAVKPTSLVPASASAREFTDFYLSAELETVVRPNGGLVWGLV